MTRAKQARRRETKIANRKAQRQYAQRMAANKALIDKFVKRGGNRRRSR